MNIQNKQFYDALLALTKVILDAVSRQAKLNLYMSSESVWCRQNDNSYIKQQVNRPGWSVLLHKAGDEYTKTKEYENFIEAIRLDDEISRQVDTLVGAPFSRSRMEARNYAVRPAHAFLTDNSVEKFNKDIFDRFYLEMEKDIFSDEIEAENLTPLCGFKMECVELSLTDSICIVKLSEKDIIDFFNLGIKLGSSIGDYDYVRDVHQYAIKRSYKLPKILGEQGKPVDDSEDYNLLRNKNEQSIIDAFRIFKKGKLYPITTISRGKGFFSMGTSFTFENPVKNFMKDKYSLSNAETEEFKSFWKEKSEANLPERNFLSVAIRRFSQANERDNVEDEIIDLMISAEALFLSSGGSFMGELKYRLSHRAAMYIESDVKQQKHIFNFMQKAYEVRSSIVHGSDPKLPKRSDGTKYATLKDFCDDIEQYLRISIKKAISSDNISKGIDWNSIIFPENG